ncbi:MAG TPA: TetR/AcrR family transcriptional regulator [Hyphomicrobiales bacterium]|nr:TetR/AcrR family transcriptional regulator [Hyphomicrobiales bacterium]
MSAGARRRPRLAAAARPRTKPPEVRRGDLLAAATRLFLDKGVDPTTIDDIVAAAGVAKGTFYLYFSSKDDLVAALRARFQDRLVAHIAEGIAARPADDWQGKLRAWVERAVGGYLDDYALHDIVFHDSRPTHRHQKAHNAAVAQIETLLGEGAAAKAWRVADPRMAAIFLFHGLHGVVDGIIDAAEDGAASRRAAVKALTRLVAGVVAAAG